MTRVLAAATLLVLAACQPTKAPADGRKGPSTETCGADALQRLVGQDRSVLVTMTFATTVRVIEQGKPVTMDYSESRLNIAIGKDGRIARAYCG